MDTSAPAAAVSAGSSTIADGGVSAHAQLAAVPSHVGILIIGGGPTGLGAAFRLNELQHDSWLLLDEGSDVGGLASTVVDEQGFSWDLGIHSIFSHYDYYDRMMDVAIPREDDWIKHVRAAYVWMRDRWIPYPMQNNLWLLPDEEVVACLEGLLDVQETAVLSAAAAAGAASTAPPPPPRNFHEWLLRRFGRGLCDSFMVPYNRKVWAIEPAGMCTEWMGERVATVDLRRILRNLVTRKVETSWGPNATFRYPRTGGSHAVWKGVAASLPRERLVLGARVVTVDLDAHVVTVQDGRQFRYDRLISTMPLDALLSALVNRPALTALAPRLRYSSVHLVGLGIQGHVTSLQRCLIGLPCPPHLQDKYWMYFSEDNTPTFRVTVFSNLAPGLVPQPGAQWSLLCEVSESVDRPVDASRVVQDVIGGMLATGMLRPSDVIVSAWHRRLAHGYPTPFVGRNELLHAIDAQLKASDVLTRGRFGGWKYEVANQDHSAMQGVEAVDYWLEGRPELTYYQPDLVNTTRTR